MHNSQVNTTLWEGAATDTPDEQAAQLQQVPGGPPGYRLRRVILTNFWLYEHQEFHIPHGRLFLAGENASGKSTVLMAAIPLALDGDYRPERIDTFGKREKRIDYYILGSNESATPFVRDQRTSYVALEFEWCDTEQPPFASELRALWERGEYEKARYLTIGIAFAGNRNNMQPINPTRFLLTDGSRLEYDIPTYHESREGRRAYDLKAFKKTVAEHGIVCDTIREYEQKVSQYLFNFSNVNDFRRLIKQLLYLRQPNLNSVLSLEAVRTYLDQALPQIQEDLLQNAAKTLEIMDNLQDEISRRKRAYGAVEKLHYAQQALTIARVQVAACEFVHTHFKVSEAQSELQKTRRQITRADNELQRSNQRSQELELEQTQLTGKVSALEGSEGLQAITRLNEASARLSNLDQLLKGQQGILDDNIQRREQSAEDVTTHSNDFQQVRQQSTVLLQQMRERAQQQAYWEIAAEQLSQLWQQLNNITLEDSTPQLSTSIPALAETPVQERLTWLRSLQQIHQKIERENDRLHTLQQQEAQSYEEVDEATRQFEQDREQVIAAQQDLEERLESLISEYSILPENSFTLVHEQSSNLFAQARTAPEMVAASTQALAEYRTTIQRALEVLQGEIAQVQKKLGTLRTQQGAKGLEAQQAEQKYRHKLEEPEAIPLRSEHRQRARSRLATQNIPALPVYMLIDFAHDIDGQSQLAGGLEQMLEDAGLLDALVIPASYTEVADALLVGEGLSDCRVRLAQPEKAHEQRWFRIEPDIQAIVGDNSAIWQETLQALLTHIEQELASQDGHWQHGLLMGTIGEGRARYVGRANRVHEQEQERERLRQAWEWLQNALQDLNDQIIQTAQQQHIFEEGREQMRHILKESGFEARHTVLQATLDTLRKAEERYQKVRIETQNLRQGIQAHRVQLQREAQGFDLFIHDASRIEQAYEQARILQSNQQTLQGHLQHLLRTWQAYKRASTDYADAKAAEFRTAQAHKRIEQQSEQTRTEVDMLRQILREREGDSAEDLFAQLHTMQARLKSLPQELRLAQDGSVKAQTNLDNFHDAYSKAEEASKLLEQQSRQSGEHLLATLNIYPVESLQQARQTLTENLELETAQRLLNEPLLPQDEVYFTVKTELEERQNQASNKLFQMYSEVINLLHEYGTSYDEHGTIRFTNAEHATPIELLTRLAEEIAQQERLLDERERTLFQDFLLKEMADTIRKHILDAEDWIDRMNKILGKTAFVEEYYYLQWVSKDPEQLQTGSYLAQYHHLLRRQAQTLKDEEIDALVHAFRQEITALRTNAQAGQELPFAQALAHIFDYRNWFKFEIFVKKVDGSRQHLTDRFLKKRSGAEQYIALYVPFFAALSALYESAGKGAPRLIALDEAFDKVSLANTQRLLKFLASQQFQWIMTGPRVSGEGTEIPACVRYVMLHRKGSELATGYPSFWQGKQK